MALRLAAAAGWRRSWDALPQIVARRTRGSARTSVNTMTTLSGSDGQGPRATLPFDSNRFVTQLQHQGFSAEQSEAVLDALKSTMKEALDVQDGMLATKSEHVQLKSELTDRVFNSTLKFDIAQRHMRDLLERDFNNLKQDIRMIEKNDFDKVRNEIVDMEKRFLLQKQITDRMVHKLHLANETMETMIMKFSVAGGATLVILIAIVGTYFEKS
ncbi:hypothetical protein, variant [Aphanomyces invadans]|uniref:DUF1640 domain-containing protein n=1 Tax=Aphanomyces invadans TaxID=157072 RepID=A0A024TPU0_9STRA|nr:hypothetical protein, variant [Aphanomyces invadans]ETV95352.1 hypothetical protein, variant [Aphanomyces invadans]|eukprot:XP_008876053.1 hypothetical protein, variant [Aphanomyces invadans]